MQTPKVYPGIHPSIDLNFAGLGRAEKHIIWQIKQLWYITFVKFVNFKGSFYSFIFARPTDKIKEAFRLEREVLFVLTRYNNFDARTLDFVDRQMFEFQNRLDKLCFVLVSNDTQIQQKINQLTLQEPETRIIIPYHYDEFFEANAQEIIWQRLKEQFYGRDLFSFESPLQSDTYFFGRNEFVHFYYDKYRSGENSGLFGLRKIGKTSVLFALQRQLKARDEFCLFIDCQDPSLHKRRWFEALELIVKKAVGKIRSELDVIIETTVAYTEKDASMQFASELGKIYAATSKKRILLIFDEIENLTFQVSPTAHWKDGTDYISFWQTIRSTYQNNPTLFSFLIAGVNPKIIETGEINGFDNPIYRMITPKYLNFFTVEQVKEMVTTIGNYMGLSFDEEIFTYLTEDYGGHPFLIRQICSFIHNEVSSNRPYRVSKYHYKSNKENLDRKLIDYVDLIIQVLRNWYTQEHKLLEYLAVKDQKRFKEESSMSPLILQHLFGYNLIQESDGSYFICIKAVEEYLTEHTRVVKQSTLIQDKWKVITERRGLIERKLRELTKLTLKLNFGSVKGREDFLKIIDSSSARFKKLSSLNFDQILSGENEIYLDDLKKFIVKEWTLFEKVFTDKQFFEIYMNLISVHRADAHAKELDDNIFQSLIIAYDWLDGKINNILP
jgi:hypothetical protein